MREPIIDGEDVFECTTCGNQTFIVHVVGCGDNCYVLLSFECVRCYQKIELLKPIPIRTGKKK